MPTLPTAIYFGPIVTDNMVEAAVKRSLMGWLPTYIPLVAARDGGGDVTLPRSYQMVRDLVTKWPEQAMPAVVCEIGGTISVTRKGSKYRAVFGASIGAIVAGPTRDDTRRIASVYATAIALALTQHGDLDGFADGIEWTDTQYDDIDESRSRTLMAAIVSLDVAVNDILDVTGGPSGPTPEPEDPPIEDLPSYGAVDDVDTTLVITPIGEDLP